MLTLGLVGASLGCGVVLVDVGQSNLAKALYTALGNGLSESVQLCSLSVREMQREDSDATVLTFRR